MENRFLRGDPMPKVFFFDFRRFSNSVYIPTLPCPALIVLGINTRRYILAVYIKEEFKYKIYFRVKNYVI